MSNTVTVEQFSVLLAIIARILPKVSAMLPDIEATIRLAGGDSRERLADSLLATLLLLKGEEHPLLGAKPVPPSEPHKECIKGDEAFVRTDKDSKVVGVEDCLFIRDSRSQCSEGVYLTMKLKGPDNRSSIPGLTLYRKNGVHCGECSDLGNGWTRYDFVLNNGT